MFHYYVEGNVWLIWAGGSDLLKGVMVNVCSRLATSNLCLVPSLHVDSSSAVSH